MENELDMQKLNYFTEGNTFTGGQTKDPVKKTLLRYRVQPDLENEKLYASCWAEDVCFERAGEKQDAEFPLGEEGLSQLKAWLGERFAEV